MRARAVKSSANSRIDTHTSVVAAGRPPRVGPVSAAGSIITPIITPVFSGRAVEQSCLELAAAGSRGLQLRPRPTPIRASLSGLITISRRRSVSAEKPDANEPPLTDGPVKDP